MNISHNRPHHSSYMLKTLPFGAILMWLETSSDCKKMITTRPGLDIDKLYQSESVIQWAQSEFPRSRFSSLRALQVIPGDAPAAFLQYYLHFVAYLGIVVKRM